MFILKEKEEEKMKALIKESKGAQTLYLPVEFEGYYYNARLLQKAYKKLIKLGKKVAITSVERSDGAITIRYQTQFGKGSYRFEPIPYDGFAPKAELIRELKIIFCKTNKTLNKCI